MMFLESRDLIEQLARTHLEPDVADEILRRSMPAIALRAVEEETRSWLYGHARIDVLSAWPSVDGRQLKHTARIHFEGIPKVFEQQPETGFLSFFDGYPWGFEVDWDFSSYGHVRYDDGHSVEERSGPPIPTEIYYPDEPQYVVAEGPYWTLPPSHEIRTRFPGHDAESLVAFSDAVQEQRIKTRFCGQLFGRPQPIQGDITPEPRHAPEADDGDGDGWIHLASFEDSVGVFDYYFATTVEELGQLTLTDIVFDAQCD